ncbi:sialidase family protein [Kribbella sp. NPDC004138]
MTSSHRPAWNRFIGLTGLAVISLVAATTATATGPPAPPYTVKTLTTVSGPTPFAAGCPGAFHDELKIPGLVVEPAIAVNPRNPRNLIATWKQDISPEFNARDDLVASSFDGGKTWRRTAVPGLTRCTGGTADTASDPWVSFGGDGTAYFGGQAGLVSTDPDEIAIVASHSNNGGRRWAPPATVAPRLAGNETPAITGSPTKPGHAYMTWANFRVDIDPPWTNTVSFSRTRDRGATWSPPVLVDQADPFAIDLAPRIQALPDGTLLAIFARADFATQRASIQAARSLDEGRTWLPPVEAGSKPLPGEFHDPETGDILPQPGFPSSTVRPDGTVYVAYENSTSPTAGGIGIVKSSDGGRTWTTITLPGVSAFAFEPAIAVDKHGTVGVIWYDLRNDRAGDTETTADVWFSSSRDAGATWQQIHVAGPTDLRTAAPPAQNRFGEYQGLAGLKTGFAAIFGLATPQAQNGPTDIFFAQIAPGR